MRRTSAIIPMALFAALPCHADAAKQALVSHHAAATQDRQMSNMPLGNDGIPSLLDFNAWLAEMKRLGNDASAKSAVLLERVYASLPDGEAYSGARQRHKRELLKILAARLKNPRKEEFLTEVLRKEIEIIHVNAAAGNGVYYPYDLLRAVLETADKHKVSEAFFAEVELFQSDCLFGRWARVVLRTASLRHELFARERLSPRQAAAKIAAIMPAKTILGTPHDIYKDKEKRIAYGKREDVLAARKAFGVWFRADAGILHDACEEILVEIGAPAAIEIAEILAKSKIKNENFDSLAVIAAKIICEAPASNGGDSAKALSAAADKLAAYCETMPDSGVFSHCHYLRGYLDAYRKKSITPKPVALEKPATQEKPPKPAPQSNAKPAAAKTAPQKR